MATEDDNKPEDGENTEDQNRILEVEEGEEEDEGNKPAPNSPPKSNADRAAEKAAKEAAEKAAKEGDEEGEEGSEEDDGEDEDAEDKPLDTSVWGDTGNDVANSVLETLQNSGVTPDEAKALLWDAVEAGDPTKVDRDALVEKVGKAKATLIMAGVKNVTDTNNKQIAEVTAIAHDAAGSKADWDKATKWANAKMDPNDLDELRAMIDKGGKSAKFATAELVAAYNADPKNTALEAGKGQITPDTKSTKKVEGISRLKYGQELEKLHNRGGTQAEFDKLKAQRNAGKAQGL